MLQFNATPEELNIFLDELEEQLQDMEENIVKLEKEADVELIREIFRIAHTIKGSAASLGHHRMANLTHAMENILDKLRQGIIGLEREIIDALFESIDVLRILKKEMETRQETDIDLDSLIYRFEQLIESRIKKEQKITPTTVAKIKEEEIEEVVVSVSKALDDGFRIYYIEVTFTSDCKMPVVRAFQVCLIIQKEGEIKFCLPSLAEMKIGEVTFERLKIVYQTILEEDRIREIITECLEVDEVYIEQITLDTIDILIERLKAEAVFEKKEEKVVSAPERIEELIAPEIKKAARTIRVSVDILDALMNLVGELVIDKNRLGQLGAAIEAAYEEDYRATELVETTLHVSKIINELQEQVMKARLVPIEIVFNKFPRMIRDLSLRAGKEVNLIIEGEETELDRAVIEEIGDPLIHLLRNSIDHGIESPEERIERGKTREGSIRISAYHQENYVIVTVKDDGAGIDIEKIKQKAIERGLITLEMAQEMIESELLDLIFLPGFSTAEIVTDVSGRGVGMDIVKNNIQKIGGSVEVYTKRLEGTTFLIRIPLTLAIMQAMLVTYRGSVYAIPLTSLSEIVKLDSEKIMFIGGRRVFVLRGNVVPLTWLGEFFDQPFPDDCKEFSVVVVFFGDKRVGIAVDTFIGKQEIVIKTLGQFVRDIPGISGATILGDGTVGLILDVASFINMVAQARRYQIRKAS